MLPVENSILQVQVKNTMLRSAEACGVYSQPTSFHPSLLDRHLHRPPPFIRNAHPLHQIFSGSFAGNQEQGLFAGQPTQE